MREMEAVQLRIRELCKEQNLTLGGLSTRSGITKSTLDNLFSGRNKSVTVSTGKKICDGREISLIAFFNSDLFRNLDRE